VLEDKACAFVKFRLRAAAEFAKEAMACQVCKVNHVSVPKLNHFAKEAMACQVCKLNHVSVPLQKKPWHARFVNWR
jgi:hypothetical protein